VIAYDSVRTTKPRLKVGNLFGYEQDQVNASTC